MPDAARNHAPAAGAGNLTLIDARLSSRSSRYTTGSLWLAAKSCWWQMPTNEGASRCANSPGTWRQGDATCVYSCQQVTTAMTLQMPWNNRALREGASELRRKRFPGNPQLRPRQTPKAMRHGKTELIERLESGDLDAIAEPETTAKMRALQESNRLIAELLRAKLLAIPKVRVALLDAAFGTKRGAGNGAQLQGQLVEWPEVVPWPEAVDGPALLAEIARLFWHYVSLPNGGAEALALWALYNWVFEAFAVCPNLMVTAPERESGKTRVTELLSWMVPRPNPVSDASVAVIFRGIERDRPTLLFDEAQHFLRRRPDDPIRGILLAGFSRRFAIVNRCEGDNHEPRRFSTFAPKAMNGRKLAALDDMLTSRSVVIPMTRARKRYPGPEGRP